jgi:tripartite-type tricarboxylate transporter receptor subunit TctC
MARLALGVLLFALAATAGAQQFPSRAIRLIVPNPPGGATDTLARVFAPRMSELIGQPVIVDNRPGSNGNVASEMVARAAPDGYMLYVAADAQIVIGPHLYKTNFDALKDFAPVATLANTQMLLAVHPSLPVKNLQEFVEYARQAKPPLAYGSIGNGSQHHLVMEMLKARAGIDLLHVPFKGGGPATIALLAGEISAAFGGNSVTGHVKAGKLRALAVAGKDRSTTFPDLPRLADVYPGLEVTPWIAVFAPSGVPAPILAKLRDTASTALAEPATQEAIRRVGGLEPYRATPEEFSALIRAEYTRYGEIINAVGVRVD